MIYLWLKAFHIAAVALWVGGTLLTAVVVSGLCRVESTNTPAGELGIVRFVRAWDRRVTTPAMLAVWALGLALAISGGWFPQGWLLAKLVVVFLLSALHGTLTGRLRRLAGGNVEAPTLLRHAPAAIALAVMATVILVVVKPL